MVWDLQGVFDSEVKAVAACRDWTYCIWPIAFNQALPYDSIEVEAAYYPLANDAPRD
jgi:hypothetical protein